MIRLAPLLLVAAWPSSALACSVCFTGAEETRLAFMLTAGLLTLLPFALIGGSLVWLARRAKQLEAEPTA